jgi:hypothetical protein
VVFRLTYHIIFFLSTQKYGPFVKTEGLVRTPIEFIFFDTDQALSYKNTILIIQGRHREV